jgi:hypothetical protein
VVGLSGSSWLRGGKYHYVEGAELRFLDRDADAGALMVSDDIELSTPIAGE